MILLRLLSLTQNERHSLMVRSQDFPFPGVAKDRITQNDGQHRNTPRFVFTSVRTDISQHKFTTFQSRLGL